MTRTLIIYSGPTSTDRSLDKNGMYFDNMDYFLEHGVDCSDTSHQEAQGQATAHDDASVDIQYVFVLTQEVADHYLASEGKITHKRSQCSTHLGESSVDEYIKVVVRHDRCYDMESMRVVLENEEMDVQSSFDHLLFVNCGLVGPKFGPGSPRNVPSNTNRNQMVPYRHWSQIYTSCLTPTLRLVGHSINTHFHTYFPHVQSFLYALTPATAELLVREGAIYDCGLTQAQLAEDTARRFELIERYEVGMSTTLLKKGYSIGTAFINRWGFGTPLILNQNSTQGTELDDTISDIWYEDGVRNLTRTMDRSLNWWSDTTTLNDKSLRRKEDTFDYHQWDILPWDHYLFFKVSRLVPQDIQDEMQYSNLDLVDVAVISNDPRKSPSEYWQSKTREFDGSGLASVLNVIMAMLLILLFYRKRKQIQIQLRFLMKQSMTRNGRDD